MSSPIVEAFSLTHAQILDGNTTFAAAVAAVTQDLDLYGVSTASVEPDSDSYENEGDDVVLSRWDWLNKAELKVESGYVSFPTIAALTGQTISSSGSGDAQVHEVDLWHEDGFNVGTHPVLVRMPSKDKDHGPRIFDICLYAVSFSPIMFDGPQYKDGLKVSYTGTALLSAVDELGVAHTDGRRRVGKLVSTPTP